MKFTILMCLLILSLNLTVTNGLGKSLSRKGVDDSNVSLVVSVVASIVKNVTFQSIAVLMAKLIKIADIVTQALFPPPTLPLLDQDRWWGDDDHHHVDTSIRPFYLKFEPEKIKRLIFKLKYRENFTEPLKGAAMTYGSNTNFINHVLDYWLHEYDFEKGQRKINTYPQYITNIQGLDIHFIHIKPKATGKKVVPLLILHGWPLNNLEFLPAIPYLIEPQKDRDFVFEIIAPTIPGFGYSQATNKIGLSYYQVGIIFKNLMDRLGIKKFYIHGGDFGQIVGDSMGVMYPNKVLGFHTNLPYSFMPQTLVKYVLGALHPPAVVEPEYVERMYPIGSRLYYIMVHFGYFHMQATYPDVVGLGTSDSPGGLISWIFNGLTWSTNPNNMFDDDGNLFKSYNLDDLIDLLTVMWDAQYMTTSMRLYAETTAAFQDPTVLKVLLSPNRVPYAAIKFRYEIIYEPDDFLKDKYPNLIHSTTLDYGGHVAAYETPKVLTDDIWKSIDKMIQFNQKKRNTFNYF